MSDTTTSEHDPLDRIEKSIEIDAPAARVFALVSRPGWWINDGTSIDENPDIRIEDGRHIVTHPEFGEFQFEILTRTPNSYVATRWIHRLPDDGKNRSTDVEFRITEQPGGGVVLHVVESGFSGLQKPRAEWLQDRSNNDQGWDTELAIAKALLEAA